MFPKVTSQGVALILFKFCLISEAQPHSSNLTSYPLRWCELVARTPFSNSLILSFSNFSSSVWLALSIVPKDI